MTEGGHPDTQLFSKTTMTFKRTDFCPISFISQPMTQGFVEIIFDFYPASEKAVHQISSIRIAAIMLRCSVSTGPGWRGTSRER
jgi:hypothetical protein